jgi:protein TonB
MRAGFFVLAALFLVAAAVAGQETTVYRPGNGVSIPRLVKEVKPSYTPEAKAAKIQGVVAAEAVVLLDGTVGEVKVVRSLDAKYGLDEQAVKAAKQWLFEPGMKEGKPAAVRVTIELSFTLPRK